MDLHSLLLPLQVQKIKFDHVKSFINSPVARVFRSDSKRRYRVSWKYLMFSTGFNMHPGYGRILMAAGNQLERQLNTSERTCATGTFDIRTLPALAPNGEIAESKGEVRKLHLHVQIITIKKQYVRFYFLYYFFSIGVLKLFFSLDLIVYKK